MQCRKYVLLIAALLLPLILAIYGCGHNGDANEPGLRADGALVAHDQAQIEQIEQIEQTEPTDMTRIVASQPVGQQTSDEPANGSSDSLSAGSPEGQHDPSPDGIPSEAHSDSSGSLAGLAQGQASGALPGEAQGATSDNLPDGQHEQLPRDLPSGLSDALPDGPVYEPILEASGPSIEIPPKVAYITIDDGPSRSVTPGILDVLLSEGIHATFFVLPNKDVEDLYRRIIDEGHEIGNHSFSHNYSKLYQYNNLKAFTDDVLKARDFILDNYGYETVTYRFPGGTMGRNSETIAKRKAALEEMGYRYFNWHIDSGDARSHTDKSATSLTNNVLNNTRGREHVIVLMHDSAGRRSTLQALPRIIAGLRDQGYTFDVLRNYPQE